MYTMWDAPSDIDYWDQFNPGPDESEDPDNALPPEPEPAPEPEMPHASDCAVWVGETCDCMTGRRIEDDCPF